MASCQLEDLCSKSDVPRSWINIRFEFFESLQDLQLGEVLLADDFDLFAALSAVEMMDPRTDTGLVRPPLTVKENLLKIVDVPMADVVCVVDSTFARLVSWLEGESPTATVLTNLYLQDPGVVLDRTLHAFSVAVCKLVQSAEDIVRRGSVAELEDFQPTPLSWRTCLDVSVADATQLLEAAEAELRGDSQTHVALQDRLKLSRLLLTVLCALNAQNLDASSLRDSVNSLEACSEIISSVERTASTSEVHGLVPEVFEPQLSLRLHPWTFPRLPCLREPREAYTWLKGLFLRLRRATTLFFCSCLDSSLELLREIGKDESTCILSRSLAQILFFARGRKAFEEALIESTKNFTSPPVLVLPHFRHLHGVKDLVDCFTNMSIEPLSGLAQAWGQNRGRQRRTLAQLLTDFRCLEEEAEKVDAMLASVPGRGGCFGPWLAHRVISLMLSFVLSGFQLELYSPHEYQYVFWYLGEFLYGALSSCLRHAEQISSARHAGLQNVASGREPARCFAKEIVLSSCLERICKGYYKVLTGLRMEGDLTPPRGELGSERMRFEHRFEALRPAPVGYADFQAAVTKAAGSPSKEIYRAAAEDFQAAKVLLQTVPGPDETTSELTMIAKTNSVVAKLLASQRENLAHIDFDFSAHSHFPILKLGLSSEEKA